MDNQNKHLWRDRLVLVVIIGIMAGLILRLGLASTGTSASYAAETENSMIDKSTAILVGEVADISLPFWNQEGGLPYTCGQDDNCLPLPLQSITIRVTQPLAIARTSKLDYSGKVVVTTILEGTEGAFEPPHGLSVGDHLMVFVRETELAWRDGTRPVIMLMGYPPQSYFKQGSDGKYQGGPEDKSYTLEQLVAKMRSRRSNDIQPNAP